MGFFSSVSSSSTGSSRRLLHDFLPFASMFFSSSTVNKHELSFDLTPPPSSDRKVSTRRAPCTRAVPIPLEVVMNIMEVAFYDDNLEPSVALLQACSLVCRHWATPAQKLLFKNVTLRTQPAYLAFKNAVDRSTMRGRMLGDAVVRMRVVLDHNQPSGLSHHSFAHAVTMCPNLWELNLALYGCASPGEDIVGAPDELRMQRPAPSFNEATLDLLRSGPRISALQFSNWSENRHSITQLLDVWPTLTSLAISGTPPVLPSVSSAPFRCALTEFRMNFQTSPSIDFMKWMLHNSVDTLRVLEFAREPSLELLEYLVDSHGPTLHSLALPACSSHECARAVQKCKHLRELRMENAWVSPSVYRQLPDTLQHIAFGLDRDTSLQPVLDIVKSRPSLRAVTVQLWDGGEHHPQFAVLKIACAYRGVDLRMTKDIHMFRSIARGDPIPPQYFPRVKSFENFHVMHL